MTVEEFGSIIRLIERIDGMDPMTREREITLRAKLRERWINGLTENGLVRSGDAAEAHPMYRLPETEFRQFLRRTDNDPDEQAAILNHHLDGYERYGEFVPPYPAWRIVVILRRAKRRDLEARFLVSWLRCFYAGIGTRYDELELRARKLGVDLSSLPPRPIRTPRAPHDVCNLSMRVKSVTPQDTDGTSYYFDFDYHCTECGSYRLSYDDGIDLTYDTAMYCGECKVPFGRYGAIQDLCRAIGKAELTRRGL
ncbi:hypothetical protein [Aurantimonas sp. 22II-16-19i]|uniref:hypothetical protein n=1 Tax=Aurantimonas sp. 22II-16-19i TaxID=1317114 RepID=UPI0009F7FCC9|nr:hypothetical protein [Aurantimonas sp. 22II-16-19i]ORE97465.1 hypothetical protein ATO4_09102 [Aurantimonas sp. 22II-16-19i]